MSLIPQILYHGTTSEKFDKTTASNDGDYCCGPVYFDEILEFPIKHAIAMARTHKTDPILLVVDTEKVSGDIIPRELDGWYETDFLNKDSFAKIGLGKSYEESRKMVLASIENLLI